jgi:hypothetical protein
MLEVDIEAALLLAESPEHVRRIRRLGSRIRRRWRHRELVECGMADFGGEA